MPAIATLHIENYSYHGYSLNPCGIVSFVKKLLWIAEILNCGISRNFNFYGNKENFSLIPAVQLLIVRRTIGSLVGQLCRCS